jgi:hypothetical protein
MKKLTLILILGIFISCNVNKSSSSSTFKIGVQPCDEYLSEVEIFLKNPNVPQTMQDSYKQSMEQNRMAWKHAIATEQGRLQLQSSCKTALDSAKPVFIKYRQK